MTPRSAFTPAYERETEEARRVSPGLLSDSVVAAKVQIFGTTLATTVPTTRALLSWILTTRYCRPNTVCRFFEKLTSPDSVGTLLNFSIWLASTTPFVDPCARRIAVTTPSTAAGPVMKPPVPACTCFASLLTAAFGSSPKTDANVTK